MIRHHAFPAGELTSGDEERELNLETVRRFVSTVPSLHGLLSAPVVSAREAMLRTEMRRTIGALSAALDDAAQGEASPERAAVFCAASTVAAQLATQATHERRAAARDH